MKNNTINNVERIKCSSESLAEMLDSTQWANEFSWNQLIAMSDYMKAYRAVKGTVIFNEGALESSLGIIVEGRIDIIKTDDQKTQGVIATLVAGNTFGEMSLIDAEPRSAQAVASKDVVMLIMTKDALFDLEKITPSLAIKLLWRISTMISQRLRRTSGQLVDYLSEND